MDPAEWISTEIHIQNMALDSSHRHDRYGPILKCMGSF
jgi:hypothetical protein